MEAKYGLLMFMLIFMVLNGEFRMDAALFFVNLQEILDKLTSEIQREIILANFVLVSTYSH